MRAYVMTTGVVFGLLTLAHLWSMIEERQLVTEPWYVLITVAAGVLCLWAWRLVWRMTFSNSYRLYAATFADDGSLKIGGMIVGYILQVSPAPLTATFNDVPTSDFAFQFVEAFNAAGITVGCNASPPQFCPDRNVTLREMAVFFAKALGLQLP
jgi:hypothetical protein